MQGALPLPTATSPLQRCAALLRGPPRSLPSCKRGKAHPRVARYLHKHCTRAEGLGGLACSKQQQLFCSALGAAGARGAEACMRSWGPASWDGRTLLPARMTYPPQASRCSRPSQPATAPRCTDMEARQAKKGGVASTAGHTRVSWAPGMQLDSGLAVKPSRLHWECTRERDRCCPAPCSAPKRCAPLQCCNATHLAFTASMRAKMASTPASPTGSSNFWQPPREDTRRAEGERPRTTAAAAASCRRGQGGGQRRRSGAGWLAGSQGMRFSGGTTVGCAHTGHSSSNGCLHHGLGQARRRD